MVYTLLYGSFYKCLSSFTLRLTPRPIGLHSTCALHAIGKFHPLSMHLTSLPGFPGCNMERVAPALAAKLIMWKYISGISLVYSGLGLFRG